MIIAKDQLQNSLPTFFTYHHASIYYLWGHDIYKRSFFFSYRVWAFEFGAQFFMSKARHVWIVSWLIISCKQTGDHELWATIFLPTPPQTTESSNSKESWLGHFDNRRVESQSYCSSHSLKCLARFPNSRKKIKKRWFRGNLPFYYIELPQKSKQNEPCIFCCGCSY